MMQNLEERSPRSARFAIFVILLVHICATSTAKPSFSMDESAADDVRVQNGDSDSNHQVVIPMEADIPGVPVDNILHQPDINPLHRYPRDFSPRNIRCVMDPHGACQVVISPTGTREEHCPCSCEYGGAPYDLSTHTSVSRRRRRRGLTNSNQRGFKKICVRDLWGHCREITMDDD